MHESICLFFFSHSSISFFCSSTSYYIRSWVNRFAYSFFTFTYFFSFLSFIFIYNMKVRQSFCLLVLSYGLVSLSCSSSSYDIRSRVNRFAYSFFTCMHYFVFPFLSFILIYNMKLSQTFCLLVLLYSSISFSFASTSYSIWS